MVRVTVSEEAYTRMIYEGFIEEKDGINFTTGQYGKEIVIIKREVIIETINLFQDY